MTDLRRRFTIQAKLAILNEADMFGTAHVLSKYDLSPSVLSRWQKDLKSSRSRKAAIRKEDGAQTIESLKAEIERLQQMIADQVASTPPKKQKPEMDKPTANRKAQELYDLVASLIVEIVLREFDEEFESEDIYNGEPKDKA